MNGKTLLSVLSAAILGGCSYNPSGEPYTKEFVIKEISFSGAHQDEHCSKGCRYEYVPDRWYIHFCNVLAPTDCYWRSIEHAPWKWQYEGYKVKWTRQVMQGYWGNSYRKDISFVSSETGEQLVM